MNLYTYVDNDPTNQSDPSGKCGCLGDIILGVVHGSGQTAFAGANNDVVPISGYTMSGGVYAHASGPDTLGVGVYGTFGPAVGWSLSLQGEAGVLFGDPSNLNGPAGEFSLGGGVFSGTGGHTFNTDGTAGAPYVSASIGPASPASGRVAAPTGVASPTIDVPLSPLAQAVSSAVQAVGDLLAPKDEAASGRHPEKAP